MKQYAVDYKLSELQAVVTAREMRDGEAMIAGVGIPVLAALTARATSCPNLTIVTEWGGVNPNPRRLMYCVSCTTVNERASMVTSAHTVLNDLQRGFLDLGIIGGAQVDKYGNVNSTLIGENMKNLKICLAGAGGATDIATSAGRTIIMIKDIQKSFVEKVDYNTSPGFLDGPGARERCGYKGGGPAAVVTTAGVFRFDDETKEMYLDSFYPNWSPEQIKALVPWDLKVSPNVHEVEPPTVEEVRIMRTIDPLGIYLGTGKAGLADDFDAFIQSMEDSFEPMDRLSAGR